MNLADDLVRTEPNKVVIEDGDQTIELDPWKAYDLAWVLLTQSSVAHSRFARLVVETTTDDEKCNCNICTLADDTTFSVGDVP